MLVTSRQQAEANGEFNHASHVDIYGLKKEGSTAILWIRDSTDINLFGMFNGRLLGLFCVRMFEYSIEKGTEWLLVLMRMLTKFVVLLRIPSRCRWWIHCVREG
jgi:hypothetical protein